MNWDRIDLAIYVAAPQDVVHWHWTTEAGMTRWFIVESAFFGPTHEANDPKPDRLGITTPIEKGTGYAWTWANGVTEEGEIVDCSPDGLRFTFGEGTMVDVRLTAEGARTLVELTQTTEGDEDARIGVYRDCQQGWTFYLANLKSMLEGGLDLRDLEPSREGLVNV